MYKYLTRDLIRDSWKYISIYKGRFWLGTILRIISDISWLYPPYALATIVTFFSKYEHSQSLAPIYTALLLILVAIILRYWCVYFGKTFIYNIAEKVELDIQTMSIRHIMSLDMEWHEHESSGSKFKRIERGAQGLQKILRIWVNNAIEIVINLFGIIFIMSRMDLNVGIAVVIFLITYYFLAHYYRKRAVILTNVVNEKDEHRNGIIFESINNIRSVKVMSMAEKIIRILWENAEDMLLSIKERIYWFQFGNSIRNFYGQIFRLAAICFIIYGIIEGKYEVGFLILFTGYFGSVWQSMSELTDVSEDFAIAKNAIYRMREILKVPITIDSEKDKILFPQDWQKISLNNVSFSYQDKKVLDGVSLEIKRGERVGIVGISGAGKSTLFKLLLKERESYEGEICFDEVSLKDISKKDYFNYLAVVLQETELFNASLRENIIITNQKEEKNAELLVNVIEMAHVKDFMEKLPKGVDSIIGEKGVKLSGGEKQRVGIARAMFKNPQIFLLDEATSHLDIESEETIKDSLHKFFKNVTAVVIAHRLTTIKEMDKIIIIENGKIVEEGSFDELQNKKGRFFELWEKQKL